MSVGAGGAAIASNMGDVFYRLVRELGRPAFWSSSAPVVAGREHIPRRGPCIVAANHSSPFDIPLLMRHVPRTVDFVSIVEVFENPMVAWFYGSMNAFPLDRSRADAPTVRTILDRLGRGRLVAMFPEGGFRRGEASVVRSRRVQRGIGRIASLAGAPVVPAVIVNSIVYARFASWLPFRATRYGVMFGPAIPPGLDPDEIETRLVEALVELHAALAPRLPDDCRRV